MISISNKTAWELKIVVFLCITTVALASAPPPPVGGCQTDPVWYITTPDLPHCTKEPYYYKSVVKQTIGGEDNATEYLEELTSGEDPVVYYSCRSDDNDINGLNFSGDAACYGIQHGSQSGDGYLKEEGSWNDEVFIGSRTYYDDPDWTTIRTKYTTTITAVFSRDGIEDCLEIDEPIVSGYVHTMYVVPADDSCSRAHGYRSSPAQTITISCEGAEHMIVTCTGLDNELVDTNSHYTVGCKKEACGGHSFSITIIPNNGGFLLDENAVKKATVKCSVEFLDKAGNFIGEKEIEVELTTKKEEESN